MERTDFIEFKHTELKLFNNFKRSRSVIHTADEWNYEHFSISEI